MTAANWVDGPPAGPVNAAAVILDASPGAADDPAFLTPQGIWTYGTLRAAVNRAGNAMRALGIGVGERVLLLGRDTPEMVAVYFGAMKIGAVAVMVNTRLSAAEVAYVARDSGARLMIVDPALEDRLDLLITDIPDGLMVLPLGEPSEIASWRGWETHAGEVLDPVLLPPEAMAFWVYSSGTTGHPKGVVHTHGNAWSTRLLLRETFGLGRGDVVMASSKLFFSYPMANGVMGPLSIGAAAVLYPDWPDPKAVIDLVERFKPAVLFTVPSLVRAMLREDDVTLAPMRHLRHILSGGERTPEPVWEQWKARVGHSIIEAYGSSEGHCVSLTAPLASPRPGVAGAPTPGTEIRLLGETGREVEAGEAGMLWVRHPCLAIGYWNQPEKTADCFRDGWFKTGDMFLRDHDGQLLHQGRADDMLKVAGQWVGPGEIEDVVEAAFAGIEVACVPVPDGDGFDRLALFIRPGDMGGDWEARVLALCEERLPRHKRPRYIRRIESIPRTATGKVQRAALRRDFRPD